jgi:hypothetical protein
MYFQEMATAMGVRRVERRTSQRLRPSRPT